MFGRKKSLDEQIREANQQLETATKKEKLRQVKGKVRDARYGGIVKGVKKVWDAIPAGDPYNIYGDPVQHKKKDTRR